MRSSPALMWGGALVSVDLFLIVFGTMLAPHSTESLDILNKLQPPSLSHPFGTDNFGRDVLSRVMAGARLTLVLSAAATLFSVALGTPIGLMAGYFGGWADELLMRLSDALLALPSLVLAMLIITVMGSGGTAVLLAVALVYAPRVARVVRSRVLEVRELDFVQAARARGESTSYILFSELLPNSVSVLIVEMSVRMGFAVLLVSSLAFLGLGVSPPAPDWGLMINEARQYMYDAPWLVLFPSLSIVISIVGFNLLGDGVRDLLDPQRVWSDDRGANVA